MKIQPPRWVNKFLEWYCRPDILEEIQGDLHELFSRRAKKSSRTANLLFAWDVLRFCRWKNIKRKKNSNSFIPLAMFKNIFLVSVRNAARNPGHTFIHVAGLSVGFTCAFLILIWVANEFSFDKFHTSQKQIYRVVTHVLADGSYQTYDVASASLDVSSVPEAEALVTVSAGQRWPHELCFRPEGRKDECVYFNGVFSNENFFKVFDFNIVSGAPHPLKGSTDIAISEKMAKAIYGTENPVGKTFKVDGYIDVIVASVFKNPQANSTLQFDFVMPFAVLKKEWGATDQRMNSQFFQAYIKTKPGTLPGVLTEKLNGDRVLTEALKADHIRYEAFPLADWRLHSKFEGGKSTGGRIEYVRLFVIIALLIILMAIINFINLTTARASLRAKEIAVRKVTGAFRLGIVGQFLGESFLSVLAAFALAVLFSQLVLHFFSSFIPGVTLNLFSGWMPIYLLGFLIVIALAAGAYPAFVLASFQPVKILKSQFSGSTGSNGLRKSLLVIQLSISAGIIIFTSIIYSQLNFIINKDLGFDRHNTIHIEPTHTLHLKNEAFRNELFKHSEIIGLTSTNANPLNSGGGNTGVKWQGKPENMRAAFSTIGCTYEFPEFFGLKILEGRNFTETESKDSVNSEVLITREAAKTMGMSHPIGEHITIGDVPCVIIGVINDFHTKPLHESRLPVILYRTSIFRTGETYVKFQQGKTHEAFSILQDIYKKFEPSYTMRYWFQDDTFSDLYKTEMMASRLVLGLSFVSLVIAVIGIVGLATFNTMRKTKEIGIRRVLGATTTQVWGLLTQEFFWVMITALIIAAPLTWYAGNQWLAGFAYHDQMPVWLFVATFGGIALLTIAIICLQSLKTVMRNPTESLRSE